MPRSRRLLALLLAFAVALSPAATATALAQDNTAIAVNTEDGTSIFELALDVTYAMRPVVENENTAVAYASCANCQTVAVAIQVVLIAGEVTGVAPVNTAIAINENCTACQTLAYAYQIVLATGGPVRLTREGIRRLIAIRKALKELEKGDFSIVEIKQRLDAITAELTAVLTTELVPVRPRDDEDEDEDDRGETDRPAGDPSSTPTPSPSPSANSTPTPTPSPSPTATPTTTPTTTPTATPTPSPEPTPEATP